jgi:hypothetical protein
MEGEGRGGGGVGHLSHKRVYSLFPFHFDCFSLVVINVHFNRRLFFFSLLFSLFAALVGN